MPYPRLFVDEHLAHSSLTWSFPSSTFQLLVRLPRRNGLLMRTIPPFQLSHQGNISSLIGDSRVDKVPRHAISCQPAGRGSQCSSNKSAHVHLGGPSICTAICGGLRPGLGLVFRVFPTACGPGKPPSDRRVASGVPIGAPAAAVCWPRCRRFISY